MNPCTDPVEREDPTPEDLLPFEVEEVLQPLAVGERRRDELEQASEAFGAPDARDPAVFVADAVIHEILALAGAAGELETGGVLVGHLHREPGAAELLAEVTAQIPARHAEATRASFAFTPETWAAADAALALRARGELVLGWWHSHPFFCRRCPEDRRRSCPFARPFFSPEDVHLHRTCFPRAWQLALLVSELPDRGHVPALFGWRAGRVTERGFRTLRRTP